MVWRLLLFLLTYGVASTTVKLCNSRHYPLVEYLFIDLLDISVI
jgi:hypothetical protein